MDHSIHTTHQHLTKCVHVILTLFLFLSVQKVYGQKAEYLSHRVVETICEQREKFIHLEEIQPPMEAAPRLITDQVEKCGWLVRNNSCETGQDRPTFSYKSCEEVSLRDLSCAAPRNFPASIPLTRIRYENWAEEIYATDIYVATPTTTEEIPVIANWARASKYKVRAMGAKHNWSPLTVPYPDELKGSNGCLKIILVNMKKLKWMKIISSKGTKCDRLVTETGATLETMTAHLLSQGCALASSIPAVGEISIGGALAIGAHGAGTGTGLKKGRGLGPNFSWGSLSNLVMSFEAVVSKKKGGEYFIQKFKRNHTDAPAFLTSLGRTILTTVELKLVRKYFLKCDSSVHIPTTLLFTKDGSQGNSLQDLVERYGGMVEIIWYPFTNMPWLKTWTLESRKPFIYRRVTSPYNYPFSDNIPNEVASLIKRITVGGELEITPILGPTMYAATAAGLIKTFSLHLWGAAKNVQLFIKPTTLRYTEFSSVILTSMENLQKIVHKITTKYSQLLEDYRSRSQFPVNGPIEIRVTGVDDPQPMWAGEAPLLSPVTPSKKCPHFNTAIWFTILSFPRTPGWIQFSMDVEQFLWDQFGPRNSCKEGLVRAEWSKGWAVGSEGVWKNSKSLMEKIPNSFEGGWGRAKTIFRKYDSANLFSNSFLDLLFNPSAS